jgi:uncharacterized membrane protein
MQKFSVQESIKFGWETFKKYPAFLIGVVLAVFIISWVFSTLTNNLSNNGTEPNLISLLVNIVGMIVNMIVSMGMAKIAITLARGGKPAWDDLYNQYPKIVNYFIASFLFGLMVIAGLILLIVPGIYLALKFHLFSYLIVDKNLGAIDALKESAKITKGSMWNLLIFWIVTMIVVIIGAILFLVGLLVAVPVVLVAGGYVYNKLVK